MMVTCCKRQWAFLAYLFFHSSFFPYRSMLKFFVKDFSGTIKARSLKLGILCNDDDLYSVRDSRAFLAYLFICSFILLSFYFKYRPNVESRSLKLGMQCNNDDLYCVRDNGLSQLICSFVLSFFFLSI